MDFKRRIAELIKLEQITQEEIYLSLNDIADNNRGDITLPCFKFAKVFKKSPFDIAETIKNVVEIGGILESVENVNGYLNFTLNKVELAQAVTGEILTQGEGFGSSTEGNGKTICIDYSSINIAKPFHIGHLGTTAIGNSLYKIYQSLGYKVVGINHLGDWGTQFGKLIVAYKKWGNTVDIQTNGVKALQEIYVRFHVEEENDATLTEDARYWFLQIEKGNPEALVLFNYFKEITLLEVGKIYDRLDVQFDSYNGESFYNDKMENVINILNEKSLLGTSEGAQVVNLEKYDMPPCLIVKADGATLYATRDLAAALYRKQTYNFYKSLYVVAYQQNLHFKQFFKVLELMGYSWSNDMVHVAYGMVSLEDGSMSSRKGNVVWLEDVLNKAVEKALDIIISKSPNITDKELIAEQVGTGAVIFSAVQNARIKDITFTYEKVLNFDGETSPYIQYTYARTCSLLEKSGKSLMLRIATNFNALDNDESRILAKVLNKYPSIVEDAANKYEPSIIAKYLIDTCQAFNKFYFEQRILNEDDIPTQNARLMLTKCTSIVLKNGLSLLGIKAPPKM